MFFKEIINILLVLQAISKVGLSQLTPPQNVRIESENLRNVLHWSPVTEGSAVLYAVQYHFDEVIGWQDVPSCSPTNGTHCEFSVVRPPVRVTLRVRAQTANQTSAWSMSKQFLARAETRLGPPGLILSPLPNGLLVQIRDASPELRAEFGGELKYRVLFWEEPAGQKERREGLSSSVPLEHLKVGANYCVQVQHIFRRRKGDLAVPVCRIVPESDEAAYLRTVWIVAVVIIIMGVLICVCLYGIYKNYDMLKKALQPSIGLPDHIHRFLEQEDFDELSQTIASTPDTVESVTYVTEGEEEVENEPSCPAYGSSLLQGMSASSALPCPHTAKSATPDQVF